MVTFVGSDADQEGDNTNSITSTLPAHQADDFCLAYGRADEAGTVPVLAISTGGWTLLDNRNPTTGRDRVEYVWYRRFTSGSETDPVMTIDFAEGHSFSTHVFRGVDTVQAFDSKNIFFFVDASNNSLPTNPPIDTLTANACVLLYHGATHDDISVAGAPTGYTIGSNIIGSTNDHRGQCTAYDLDVGALGTETPGVWTHTASPTTTAEYSVYTIALRNAQNIHVTGGTSLTPFQWGEVNKTITGDGFEATQSTGKVEIWSDEAGTIKTTQTIDSWSDTSIQFDLVQGSLPNNSVVYVVVTNASADQSVPFDGQTEVGTLPYDERLLATTKPDHYWRLNNVYTDTGNTGPQRDMDQQLVGVWTFNTQEIAADNTHSLNYAGVTDKRECTDSPNMNITVNSAERTIAFWLQLDEVQHDLGAIWKEGGATQNMAFLVGYGNVLLAQAADVPGNALNAQAWSDFKLATGRPYHICQRYSLTEDPKEFRLYIDGVEQTDTVGNPLGTGSFNSHSGDIVWGDPDNNLETGGTDIAYAGMNDIQISDFVSYSDNSLGTNKGALDKTTEIRDILFRRGAIPDDIVVTGTESAMQTALDADADTRQNWPLSFRVEAVTGGGNFELVMTDKVFDPLITLHLEYRGIDTLTIVNQGTSNFDLAKTFSPTGGTIALVAQPDVKVTTKSAADLSTITDISRVLMLAADGGDLPFQEPVTITRSGSVATVTHNVGKDGRFALQRLPTPLDTTESASSITQSARFACTNIPVPGTGLDKFDRSAIAGIIWGSSSAGAGEVFNRSDRAAISGTIWAEAIEHGLRTGLKVLISDSDQQEYNGIQTITVTSNAAYTYTVSGTPTTPATGKVVSTSAIISANTASGSVTVQDHRYTTDQPVSIRVRRGSAAPRYKTSESVGTIISSGLDQSVFLILDE